MTAPAMVADKTGSMVVPVRIDGLEKSYFTYLKRRQGAPPLVPQGEGDHPRTA